VCGYAEVFESASVSGDARVFGDAEVREHAEVRGHAEVSCGDIKKLGDVKNITGERYNITILPNHIQIGCQLWHKDVWWNFEDREILEMDGKEGLKWWKRWKPILMLMCNTEE
jgi:hypothetical protein